MESDARNLGRWTMQLAVQFAHQRLRTSRFTGSAGQIERVEIAIEVDEPKKVELPHEQHSPVQSIVRSAPWITQEAARQIQLAVAV